MYSREINTLEINLIPTIFVLVGDNLFCSACFSNPHYNDSLQWCSSSRLSTVMTSMLRFPPHVRHVVVQFMAYLVISVTTDIGTVWDIWHVASQYGVVPGLVGPVSEYWLGETAASLPVDGLVGLVVKTSASRAEDRGFESRLCWDFSGSSHTSDLKIGTPVATLPGAWR